MTFVERFYPSYSWAEPLQGNEFDVEVTGEELQISGLLQTYKRQDRPFDLLSQYELGRKKRPVTNQQTGRYAPHIRFANADSDEKLIAFVKTFGPVVAKSVITGDYRDGLAIRITAKEDFAELRRERSIYRSALSLVVELDRSSSTPGDTYDYDLASSLIREIAADVQQWPSQWDRERGERKAEPIWKPRAASLESIEQLGRSKRDGFLPPELEARIVICELVNVFPSHAFPHPLAFNASIQYGIRPLLYAILLREFLHSHSTEVCANNQCREFFETKRAGQQFCNSDCSRQHRQREYWMKRGKTLRAKRLKRRRRGSR
jgi:hypothetical protein